MSYNVIFEKLIVSMKNAKSIVTFFFQISHKCFFFLPKCNETTTSFLSCFIFLTRVKPNSFLPTLSSSQLSIKNAMENKNKKELGIFKSIVQCFVRRLASFIFDVPEL